MANMKIYRRLALLGIGGIGGRVVARAEQELRRGLCGPDGTALADRRLARAMAPFELPRCIQCVYFDFDEADNENVRRSTAELPDSVVNGTRQVVDLAPRSDSFATAAEMLRINDPESVRVWLPDSHGEPQKAPLSDGAGQMPTIARAALFETFRQHGGVHNLTEPLAEALSRLASSGADLNAISEDSAHPGIDVFVIFSAAGGTGAGTFLDVLRLLAHVHEEDHGPDTDLSIYPVVVMPSVFPTERKPADRRFHKLNAGPVLRDLFQLVDWTHTAPGAIPPIVYPGSDRPTVTASVPVKTVVLFSRPKTLDVDDLQRSIVSYMLSIVGTTVSTDRGTEFVPMSSRLINNALQGEPAPDGIGNRPASTALAAQLRIPIEEICETLSQHLLAEATRRLSEPQPGEESENLRLFDHFGAASGLDALIALNADARLPTIDGRGAAELTKQLQKRAGRAVQARAEFHGRLEATLSRLAQEADWGAGIEALAAAHDLFRIMRVILGHPKYRDELTRNGFRGAVSRIAQEPPPNPRQFTDTPPALPVLSDRHLGLQRVGINDPLVREAIRLQDEWLRWAVQQSCHEIWKRCQDSWEPRMRAMEDRIRGVVQGFESHAATEPDDFRARCARLYRERVGVVDLVPDGGLNNDLEQWYRGAVLPRLCEELGLAEDAGEARIAREIMHGRWREAYESTSVEAQPGAAHELVLKVIRGVVKQKVLVASGSTTPLLPTIETLLREASYAHPQTQTHVSEALIVRLQRALQDLLPIDFRPAGAEDGVSGELCIDVFYPASQRDIATERYLENIALKSIHHQQHDFHPLAGVDFISVVLRRESLPATAIEEYRRLMRLRAEALDHPSPGDYLKWRQRLGHDSIWLLLRPEEQVAVLRSFLAALWDGSVSVAAGTEDDPERVLVYQLDATPASPMLLDLRATSGGVSRWVDLLSAYERYVLMANQQDLARCRALIARKEPAAATPAALYVRLLEMADEQMLRAQEMHEQLRNERIKVGDVSELPLPREVQFWALLRKANELNQRASLRWRIEPQRLPGAGPDLNGHDHVPLTV